MANLQIDRAPRSKHVKKKYVRYLGSQLMTYLPLIHKTVMCSTGKECL